MSALDPTLFFSYTAIDPCLVFSFLFLSDARNTADGRACVDVSAGRGEVLDDLDVASERSVVDCRLASEVDWVFFNYGLNSSGLCSHGLCSYGLYSYDLYSYGQYSYGLYGCGLYGYGLYGGCLYSYGLCSHGLYSRGLYSDGIYSDGRYNYGLDDLDVASERSVVDRRFASEVDWVFCTPTRHRARTRRTCPASDYVAMA